MVVCGSRPTRARTDQRLQQSGACMRSPCWGAARGEPRARVTRDESVACEEGKDDGLVSERPLRLATSAHRR